MWKPKTLASCIVCEMKLQETLKYPVRGDEPEVLEEIRKFEEEHRYCTYGEEE